MNKKGFIAVLVLAILAAALLGGLSAMTDGMIKDHMGKAVTVTSSPPPDYDFLEE